MDARTLLFIVPLLGAAGLVYTFWKSAWVGRQDPGNERMQRIAAAIQSGAMAFLRAEYRFLAIFVVVVAALLAWAGSAQAGSSTLLGVAFLLGAFC